MAETGVELVIERGDPGLSATVVYWSNLRPEAGWRETRAVSGKAEAKQWAHQAAARVGLDRITIIDLAPER